MCAINPWEDEPSPFMPEDVEQQRLEAAHEDAVAEESYRQHMLEEMCRKRIGFATSRLVDDEAPF